MTGLNVGASDFVPGSRTFKELAIDSTGPSQQEQADWCEDGEAVARELAALYPQYSAQALRDVLASNGYDWYATLETLEDLERDFARDVRPPGRVQEQQQPAWPWPPSGLRAPPRPGAMCNGPSA